MHRLRCRFFLTNQCSHRIRVVIRRLPIRPIVEREKRPKRTSYPAKWNAYLEVRKADSARIAQPFNVSGLWWVIEMTMGVRTFFTGRWRLCPGCAKERTLIGCRIKVIKIMGSDCSRYWKIYTWFIYLFDGEQPFLYIFPWYYVHLRIYQIKNLPTICLILIELLGSVVTGRDVNVPDFTRVNDSFP